MSARRAALVVGFALGAACSVKLGDDLKYFCTVDSDCGGDGFVCAAPAGGVGACCRRTGGEICDQLDNDCNGLVDDNLEAETCNGRDDDCDGLVDEDFPPMSDSRNCGRCGNACGAGLGCVSGACVVRGETSCTDGADNDMNGFTDCADSSCNVQSCGNGCLCLSLRKAEQACGDGMDNDGDPQTDCADSDCAGRECGDGGCTCVSSAKKETSCSDMRDNDGDGQADCNDSDCAGQLCSMTGTFRCNGTSCNCNGGAPSNETGGGACRDGTDNDCDGLTDCAEATCNMVSCSPDGGSACQCLMGRKAETLCGDRQDNDGDALTDCADDQDCPMGTACTFLHQSGQVRSGTCNAQKLCAQ